MDARPHTAQGGFTLVEMLVAIAILSFVALAIAGMFSHTIVVNASGHDYAELAVEARVAIERLQELPFTDPLLQQTTGRTLPTSDSGFEINYSVEDFRVEDWLEIASGSWDAPDASEDTNLKRITLTVASTNQILTGRRLFTVTSLKIPG
jgi:prepilin-type N-terminal cleavage/methylation domain-containing protein